MLSLLRPERARSLRMAGALVAVWAAIAGGGCRAADRSGDPGPVRAAAADYVGAAACAECHAAETAA